MRIGMSTLSGVSYGGLTYSRRFIPELAKVDTSNEYHIFVPKGDRLSKTIHQENFLFHKCPINTHSPPLRMLWEQFIIPGEVRRRGIDVFFTAKNANILFVPCKTIVAIRNMEPLCYRQYKNHWKLNIFSWLRGELTKISVKRADRIIAVSRFAKSVIEQILPGVGERTDVVYNGGLREPVQSDTYNGQPRLLLSSSKFVAYANQLSLVEAYGLLCRRRTDVPPLWLAGGVHDTVYFEKVQRLIAEENLTDKIKILGLIPHEQLMQLYTRALAFVFPSTLEACPHTLIEAMAHGLPIAASQTEPMPEICKDAATYFDPFKAEDIAEKMEAALFDNCLRDRLQRASLERCQFFDWEKTANEMVDIFGKVHHNSAGI